MILTIIMQINLTNWDYNFSRFKCECVYYVVECIFVQVCRDIDKSIAMTLQSILNTLDKDCDTLVDKIDETLAEDTLNGKHNVKAYGWVSSQNLLHHSIHYCTHIVYIVYIIVNIVYIVYIIVHIVYIVYIIVHIVYIVYIIVHIAG